MEKFILQEQETLTNHLQAADRKAQALGESGAGFGTYMVILAAVFAGVIALRKVLPVLAYPFISDDAPGTSGPAIESPHTHEEVFSEFLEKFNAHKSRVPPEPWRKTPSTPGKIRNSCRCCWTRPF